MRGKSDAGIDDEVAQGVEAVVAAAVGHQQGLFVDDPDEAGRVAARRAVDAVKTGGGDQYER